MNSLIVNKLAEYDIETITPSNEEQKVINDIIGQVLVYQGFQKRGALSIEHRTPNTD